LTSLERIRAHPYAVSGYAVTFNQVSVRAGGRELTAPGAFARALVLNRGWYLLLNHVVDGRPSLASMATGTLHVEEDSYGLWFDAQLPDDRVGARLFDAVCRREICHVSTATWGPTCEAHTLPDGLLVFTGVPAAWEISLLAPPQQPALVGTWVQANGAARRERCQRTAA